MFIGSWIPHTVEWKSGKFFFLIFMNSSSLSDIVSEKAFVVSLLGLCYKVPQTKYLSNKNVLPHSYGS